MSPCGAVWIDTAVCRHPFLEFFSPQEGGEPKDHFNEHPKSRCASDRLLMPRAGPAAMFMEASRGASDEAAPVLPESRHLD